MRTVLAAYLWVLSLPAVAQVGGLSTADAYLDKARYAPNEDVHIQIELAAAVQPGAHLTAKILRLGDELGNCASVVLGDHSAGKAEMTCHAPADDFKGYLVQVQLTSSDDVPLGSRWTASDVS